MSVQQQQQRRQKSVKLIDTLKNIRTNDDDGDFFPLNFETEKNFAMACI